MKNKKTIIISIIYIIIGLCLIILSLFNHLDSYWSGMGGALTAVGSIRIIHHYRYNNNKTFRENYNIELNDERNKFIKHKAWCYAGYLFVLIAAFFSFVFKLFNHDLLSIISGLSVCIIITLYWISYLILKKKY